MPKRLSAVQLKTVAYLKAHVGMLVRIEGGFWTTPDTPVRETRHGKVPDWYIGIATVRALEQAGVLRRLHVHREEWRDRRVLVT